MITCISYCIDCNFVMVDENPNPYMQVHCSHENVLCVDQYLFHSSSCKNCKTIIIVYATIVF